MAKLLASEGLSITSGFGVVGDGTTDDSIDIGAALTSLSGLGGGKLLAPRPKVSYLLKSNISIPTGTTLHGEGVASLFQRDPTSDMPTNKGVVDIASTVSDVVLEGLTFDGGVTTPTQIAYESPLFTPYDSRFIKNSLVWVHGGAKKITIRKCTFRHASGYAVYIDATTGNIVDVIVEDNTFEDCLPFTFTAGAWQPSADLAYGQVGSWVGVIHVEGDGDNYGVTNFTARRNTIKRCSGNNIWVHSNWANGALPPSVVHENVTITDNNIEDNALDGIEVGCVQGGIIARNHGRRSGYLSLADGVVGTPRWFPSGACGACFIDHSGWIEGMSVTDNDCLSVNGGFIDLDGFGRDNVTNNRGRIPQSGDPAYTIDSIATFGPGNTGHNLSSGIESSNSNNLAVPGDGVNIEGNKIYNFGGVGIGGYALRNSRLVGNTIEHPAGSYNVPITLGPIGTGPYQRATGNVVTDNIIVWSPTSLPPQAAIQEDATITPFVGTDKNYVAGNHWFGTCWEFAKAEYSGSSTGLRLSSSVHGLSSQSSIVFERTTSGMTSLTASQGSSSAGLGYWFDQLYNSATPVPAVVGGPLFNVSNAGTAGSGSISTAGRTALAFDDCVATGHGIFDAFAAFTDATLGTPYDTAADLLPDTWGLLFYKSSAKAFYMSTSVAAGHRVWTPWAGSQWTTGSSLIYYNGGKVLVGATAVDGTTGVLQVTGDISMSGSPAGSVLFPSGAGLKGIDSGGNARLFLYMQTDGYSHSQVFLENINNYDIFVRPGSARYVWIGQGGAEAICPNGNNTASCGTTSYRWAGIAGVNIDISGTATGLVKSVAAYGYAALGGAVVLAAGSGAGITQSGQTITITASGSSQWTTGSAGLIYYTSGLVSVGSSSTSVVPSWTSAAMQAVVSAGHPIVFQNTDVSGSSDNLFMDSTGAFRLSLGYGNPSAGDYWQGRAFIAAFGVDFVLLGGAGGNTPLLYAVNAGGVFIGAHATDGTTGILQVAGDIHTTTNLLASGKVLAGSATVSGTAAVQATGDISATQSLLLTHGSYGAKFTDYYGNALLTLASVPVLVSTTYFSNLYLDHTGAYCASIYLRPANGQSVVIGQDGTQATPAMSALIPNGNVSSGSWVAWATLGSATYRWPTIFGTVLDLNAVPGTLAATPPRYVQYPPLAEAGAFRLYADINARVGYTGTLCYSYDTGLYLPLFALGGSQAGYFIGAGVSIGTGPINCGGYYFFDGMTTWGPGLSGTFVGVFTWDGASKTTIVFKGGIPVSVS